MGQSDIKIFIDFFHNASLKIRNQKPIFERGKDGKLIRRALDTFSRSQLEMLSLWFLAKKTKLHPRIGTMLSKKVLEELYDKIRESKFWKELDEISERYFPREPYLKEASKNKNAFSEHELMDLINQNHDSGKRKSNT